MFEIEQMEQQFDYSLVDNDTADFLRSCEYEINGIAEDARVKFGAVLIKAQEKLASNYKGVFQEWVTSSGMSLDDAYYFINLNKSSRNLDNSQRDNFLKAPKTVQKKVMQKNTPNEMKEAVLSGEVTTNKEFENLKKEYELKLKQRDELIASREQENEILQSKLEDAESREPEVIERYSEPDDYEDLKYLVKRQEEILSGREEHVSKLQKEIADMKEKRSDMDKKSKEYDQLNTAINEMNGRLSDGQLRLKNQKAVYDLIRDSKKLVSDVAPLVYAIEWLDLEDNEYAQKPLREISKNLNDIAQKINQKLDEKEIIEVN